MKGRLEIQESKVNFHRNFMLVHSQSVVHVLILKKFMEILVVQYNLATNLWEVAYILYHQSKHMAIEVHFFKMN